MWFIPTDCYRMLHLKFAGTWNNFEQDRKIATRWQNQKKVCEEIASFMLLLMIITKWVRHLFGPNYDRYFTKLEEEMIENDNLFQTLVIRMNHSDVREMVIAYRFNICAVSGNRIWFSWQLGRKTKTQLLTMFWELVLPYFSSMNFDSEKHMLSFNQICIENFNSFDNFLFYFPIYQFKY